MELIFFWLLIVVHCVHGCHVLLHAESLERSKLSARSAQTPLSAGARYLFAGALLIPGFIWAELAWLWLGLAGFTILAGSFVLIIAFSQPGPSSTPVTEIPESMIAERALERRVGLILRLMLIVIWVYAWRAYL